MCGIAGIIDGGLGCQPQIMDAFTDAVSHRGPDSRGVSFFDQNGAPAERPDSFRLALGHRRLSIIDLSDCGRQPMSDQDGKSFIVFNGEIYNYLELRAELEKSGVTFSTKTDTEVLMKSYLAWGAKCLSKFNGMWAFLIYDRRNDTLFISRDRLGVKPLYYTRLASSGFAFASEIKQFRKLPGFRTRPNEALCVSYLSSGYENPPETFYEGVYSFPPGHYATIDLKCPKVEPKRFWDPDAIQIESRDDSEFESGIRRIFSSAVRFRLRSDVPVGACLSGGLDSSSIFVEMRRLEPELSLTAFSACFDDPSADERPYMEKIVSATSSRHVKVFPEASNLSADFDLFLSHHDEPVSSMSMYAQFMVMKAARENSVPVLLDGQGGDELFSGYWPSYMLLLNGLVKRGMPLKVPLHLLGAMLPGGNPDLIGQIAKNFCEFRRRSRRELSYALSDKALSIAENLPQLKWHIEAGQLSPPEYRKAELFRIHLPRLLKWEDRNSMAFSIESRVPFLDVNLVEFVLSTPPETNMRRGWTKYNFRKAMNGILPREICWRRDKKGFETPQDSWMKSGDFHSTLLNWTAKKEHPASVFVKNDFAELRRSVEMKRFDSLPLFRLFCLDKWMENCF